MLNSNAPNELLELAEYDHFTVGHSINVAVIGLMFVLRDRKARKEQTIDFGMGLLLHDIGKKKIDKGVLLTPQDELHPKEFDHFKRHVDKGVNMLRSMEGLISSDVRELTLTHHENYDGTGYPVGLKGNDIHPYGRITRIVNAFDYLTTHRPNQTALSPYDALMKMCKNKDYFDPGMLTKFVKLFGITSSKNVNIDIWKHLASNI